MSDLKVALGERLFNDPRLSVNGTLSCAGCHEPSRAFTDGRPRAVGATGQVHARNSPSLWNVAYNVSYTWLDAGLGTLEQQLRIPLTGTQPVEMGFTDNLLPALEGDVVLMANHRSVFGDTPLSLDTIIQAIAAYVRTLVRTDSAFDRYFLYDDDRGMSDDAKAGLSLFFSERLGCGQCHAGAHLSGPTWAAATAGQAPAPVFHRTAVSDATFPVRAPSLRFVSETAPYMHDGSLPTLEAVVDFYERGGGRNAERLQDFDLAPVEREHLLAFLRTL